MVTLVCLKYGSGVYAASHVNILHRSTKKRLTLPHRFVCLTDDATGIDSDVETLPIPDIGLGRFFDIGCLAKLAVYKPGLFDETEPALYFDLDVLILDDISPFVRAVKSGGFWVCTGRSQRQQKYFGSIFPRKDK